MRFIGTMVLSVALASASLAEGKKNTFISEDLGISIEVPLEEGAEAPMHQVAMFFLPSSDRFAANVNILKQKYSETISAYDKLSTSQFKSLNMTVITRELSGSEALYEYKGNSQGRALHWYSRAIKRGAYIYLVTATGLESDWKKQEQELKESVDSFVVTK